MAPAATAVARQILSALVLLALTNAGLHAQVSYDRLRQAEQEPHNWLTYSGNYSSNRYSELVQISPANARNLEQKWVHQTQAIGPWQATPLLMKVVCIR